MSSISFTPNIKSRTTNDEIFPNTPSSLSQFHRRVNDFPPTKTLTPIKNINLQYENPEVKKVEKRIVNKELETREIIMKIFVLLVSNLAYKFLTLFFSQFEISASLKPQFDVVYYAEKLLTILKLLLGYSIVSGIYRLFKKADEFKDIKLTPQQRQLLGLPIVPTTANPELSNHLSTTETLAHNGLESIKKAEDLFSTPVKSTASSIFQKEEMPRATNTTTSTAINSISLPNGPSKQNSLIASPMSSPRIQRFAPSKPSHLNFNTSTTTIQPAVSDTSFIHKLNSVTATSLAKQPVGVSTPSYIPSPKYYYRMDSPSRSRRRA